MKMNIEWLLISLLVLVKLCNAEDITSFNNKADTKNTVEGSGATNLDDYEDEDPDLAKLTASSTTTTTTTIKSIITTNRSKLVEDELSENEFKEDFADDFEEPIDEQETTITTTITTTTRSSNPGTSFKTIFSFLTRPPIAAGILVGLSIGILLSVILLICIIQRFQKRDRSSTSYTAGLLHPNRYGYSKSPQEFYA